MIGNSRSTWCFDKRLLPSGVIHWSESKQHLGDRVSIYGEVKSTFFNWKEYERYIGFPEFDTKIPPTFLEIGETYPSKQLLRAVIWGENRKRFPKPPDELFRDSTAIITGVPYMHNDIVCVQLSAMEDVSIVDPIEGLYKDVNPNDPANSYYIAVNPESLSSENDITHAREESIDYDLFDDPPLHFGLNRRGSNNYVYVNDYFEECPVMYHDGVPFIYFDENEGGWIEF